MIAEIGFGQSARVDNAGKPRPESPAGVQSVLLGYAGCIAGRSWRYSSRSEHWSTAEVDRPDWGADGALIYHELHRS